VELTSRLCLVPRVKMKGAFLPLPVRLDGVRGHVYL
jgi:hypothetical protein